MTSAREAGRYSDENGNSGSKPHTPAPLEADCLEIYDTSRTLLTTLGYPIFDPIVRTATTGDSEEDVYYCTGSGTDARGLYTPEGFVVLKGSVGRIKNVPSTVGTPLERTREKLINSDACRIDGEKFVLLKDHLFNSPSWAAMQLMGRTANGWITWKDKHDRTLDEVVRQPATDAANHAE